MTRSSYADEWNYRRYSAMDEIANKGTRQRGTSSIWIQTAEQNSADLRDQRNSASRDHRCCHHDNCLGLTRHSHRLRNPSSLLSRANRMNSRGGEELFILRRLCFTSRSPPRIQLQYSRHRYDLEIILETQSNFFLPLSWSHLARGVALPLFKLVYSPR